MTGRQPPSVDPVLYPDWQTWAKALLRHLQLEAEQSAASRVYSLPEHPSTDLPSAAQTGLLIWKPDTLYAALSFNDTWNDIATLSTANTFTAQQLITGSTSNFVAARYISTSDDANGGPYLVLDRASPGPAANDAIGGIILRGRDSGGNNADYCAFVGAIVDATDGSEDAYVAFNFMVAGTPTNIGALGAGLVIGTSVTGSFPGHGSVNIKTEYRVEGNKVLGARITGWGAPTGTPTRTTFDTTTVTLPQLAERVKALIDDLMTHGMIQT